jgi:NAD(P)H-hydrate epimerase
MATNIDLAYAASLLPPRPDDGHKGTFGHALIIAGSRGFTGAAKLAAEAACRSGAGLVTVATPESQQDVVAAGLLEAMTIGLRATHEGTIAIEALETALDAAARRDAVAIGPGLSQHSDTVDFVREFVPACPKPMVIDADGLNTIAGHTEVLQVTNEHAIVTPHPGEMARLSGRSTSEIQNDRISAATEFAKAHRCVVALKGHGTVVAGPNGEALINTTGNAGLATGGTGDVLTGLIAGLLAQGCSPLDATALGVFVHGLAGDIAVDALTQRALIASDLCDYFPDAWAVMEVEAAG